MRVRGLGVPRASPVPDIPCAITTCSGTSISRRMLATNCPMPGRMDAAQASLVSAWMAVSREQNDHPLVPYRARPGQARS